MQLHLSEHNYYPLKSMWNICVMIGDESREVIVIGIAILGVIRSSNSSHVKKIHPHIDL